MMLYAIAQVSSHAIALCKVQAGAEAEAEEVDTAEAGALYLQRTGQR